MQCRRSQEDCSTVFCFFQAEDGIRDYKVTGVQTCALPICGGLPGPHRHQDRSLGPADCHAQRVADQGDRESGVEGKRGDLGGGRIIKKKKKKKYAYEGYVQLEYSEVRVPQGTVEYSRCHSI